MAKLTHQEIKDARKREKQRAMEEALEMFVPPYPNDSSGAIQLLKILEAMGFVLMRSPKERKHGQ